MYLREIDYKVLCLLDKQEGNLSKDELKKFVFDYNPKINFDSVLNFLLEKNYIIRHISNSKKTLDLYMITPYGQIAIDDYKIELRSKLSLPEQANKISIFSNIIAIISMLIAIGSLVLSIISFFR